MAMQEVELLLRACKESEQDRQLPFEVRVDTISGSEGELSRSQALPDAAANLTHFMDLVPVPVVLIDRSNVIRFVNSATAAISRDYLSVLGKDLSQLFSRRSDYLDMKALLENMPGCGHAQIEEGEIEILSEGVNCKIFLNSTRIAGEEFTMLVVEQCSLLKKVSLLGEQCRILVAAVPAGVAQFELPVPVPCTASPATLTSSILNARLKTANDQFARLHGFTGVDELLGALASELVQPLSATETAFRYWIGKGLPLYQTRLNCDSVDQISPQMELVLAANTDENHFVSYWIVERSLEKKCQMQALLRSLGGRFQTVFKCVDNLILMKDLDSRYQEANPAAQRLLGVNCDAIRDKTPADVWGIEIGRKIQDSDSQALKGITTDRIVTVRKGGNFRVHLTMTPMRDLEGNIIGLFEIGHLVHNPWTASKISDDDFSRRNVGRFPVCHSVAMSETLDTVWVAAKTEGIVLLTGETGSGKDYLARLIHENSTRAAGPFVNINCAGVPPDLAESELFGHESGAFTGAKKQKKGMLELANGGTLLMNEIGDLPLPLQAKLLTFLDTNTFLRVGGTKEISVDARILTATNHALTEDIAAGRFRQDLFYRLNVLSIVVPPLRERREDLLELIRQILTDLAGREGHRSVPQLNVPVMSALVDYDWPGNVRELKSVLQRVLIFSESGEITTKSLGLEDVTSEWAIKTPFPREQSLKEVLDDVKHALIEEALRRTGGKRQDAAQLLGISRNSLKHHMRARAERKGSARRSAACSDKRQVAAKEASRP